MPRTGSQEGGAEAHNAGADATRKSPLLRKQFTNSSHDGPYYYHGKTSDTGFRSPRNGPQCTT